MSETYTKMAKDGDLASLAARVSANETAIGNKADKLTTYTKSEVDEKVAGVQTFRKLLVNELPSAESADDKAIYLVPRTGSETPNLCDEYVAVGEAGSRRWEKIGGGMAVDVTLDDAVTRTSANGVKSSGIWFAIWGALTALPSGVASLYDWCVTQLSRKQAALSEAQLAAANSGATEAKVTTWDSYAAQIAAKANAADLRYMLTTAGSSLLDRASNAVTGEGALTLPAAVPGRIRDLIVDVDNSTNASDLGLELASDATAYLDAGGARYLVAVADGDDLADLLTVAAGKRARLYFTETAQTATPTGGTSAVPVISLQRLTVTVGGAA